MRRLRSGMLVAALIGAVTLGCAPRQASRSALATDTSARRFEIRTDSTRYTAERTRGEIHMTMGISYLNHGSNPIYITGCRGPRPPSFARRADEGWVDAYAPAVLGCRSPPVVVPPGRTYHLTYHLRAATAAVPYGPKFVEPVVGTYRLRLFDIYDTLDRRGDTLPILRVLVPDSLLFSNEFEIVEK